MRQIDKHNDESKIIEAVLDGDVEAYSLLVHRYQNRIYGVMIRGTGQPESAADLAQDAFIKAYNKLRGFRIGQPFYPWLHTIAMNVLRDHFRKIRRTGGEHLPLEEGLLSGDFPPVEEAVEARQLEQHIRQMPVTYREALILRYREEYSVNEVARALGIGLSAAKMRISRGMEMLRELLGVSNETF